jgi:serine/threonine protein phosphatase PrpC
MKKSDIVVMGSDGLFDNVFDEDMQPCLLKELKMKNGAIELESP